MQADLYRLTRTKSIYVLLGIFIALFIFSAITQTVASIGVTNESVNQAKQGVEWDFVTSMKYFTINSCLLIYCFIIYYLNIFSIEFSNQTFKNILMAGTSRSTFIISKLSMLFFMLISTTVIIYLIMIGVNYLYYGQPDNLPDEFLINTCQFIIGLSLCIMVYYIVASFLQILFNSNIIAIIFIVLTPIAVQILQVTQGWNWLKYIDYLSLTQAFGLNTLDSSELLPYIYINGIIVTLTILFSILLLKRKAF